ELDRPSEQPALRIDVVAPDFQPGLDLAPRRRGRPREAEAQPDLDRIGRMRGHEREQEPGDDADHCAEASGKVADCVIENHVVLSRCRFASAACENPRMYTDPAPNPGVCGAFLLTTRKIVYRLDTMSSRGTRCVRPVQAHRRRPSTRC